MGWWEGGRHLVPQDTSACGMHLGHWNHKAQGALPVTTRWLRGTVFPITLAMGVLVPCRHMHTTGTLEVAMFLPHHRACTTPTVVPSTKAALASLTMRRHMEWVVALTIACRQV